MTTRFESEKEIEAKRQLRQQEWERVRRPDQPKEAPEESYDHRSLYERLQEQKQKRDFEYEEAHRFKNLVKQLDDDDVEFLDFIDDTKSKLEREKLLEERKELEEFRHRVAAEQSTKKPPDLETIMKTSIRKNKDDSKSSPKLLNQSELLTKGAVVVRKRKLEEDSKEETQNKEITCEKNTLLTADKGALKCIGILPGMGNYYDVDKSSDSNSSEDESSSDEGPKIFAKCSSKVDILGRKVGLQDDNDDQ